jgi:hypothetical protein
MANKERKQKSFKAEVLDTNEKGIVTIAISRFDKEDMGGDITKKGAFAKTFKEDNGRIKHVLDHRLMQSAVVGLPSKMYETDKYAIVESALNLEKEISRDLFSDYKFFQSYGKTLEHSYAYRTTKGEDRFDNAGKYLGEIINELKMFEYSTTAMGMNADTPLLGLKTEDDLKALEQYLRKFNVSEKHAKEIQNIIDKVKALREPSTDTPENVQPHLALNLQIKSVSGSEMFKLKI